MVFRTDSHVILVTLMLSEYTMAVPFPSPPVEIPPDTNPPGTVVEEVEVASVEE